MPLPKPTEPMLCARARRPCMFSNATWWVSSNAGDPWATFDLIVCRSPGPLSGRPWMSRGIQARTARR